MKYLWNFPNLERPISKVLLLKFKFLGPFFLLSPERISRSSKSRRQVTLRMGRIWLYPTCVAIYNRAPNGDRTLAPSLSRQVTYPLRHKPAQSRKSLSNFRSVIRWIISTTTGNRLWWDVSFCSSPSRLLSHYDMFPSCVLCVICFFFVVISPFHQQDNHQHNHGDQ